MNTTDRNQPEEEQSRSGGTPESAGRETGKGMFSNSDTPEAQRAGMGSTPDGETTGGAGSDADMGGGYSNMDNAAEGREEESDGPPLGTESRH